ncbi:MAG: hypothetical protein Q7J28_06040 [Caulobacter sp.]|nr:hypothetical protein [Caulobacter sp.]
MPKTMLIKTVAFAALGAVLLVTPRAALAQATPASAARVLPAFEQDRQAVLAMAGEFKVRFDFRETAAFVADYTPIAPKVSGGYEVVRVIEDSGRVIRLQHLLVVDGGDGKPMVIKHWRQDWAYEPARILTYAGPGKWVLKDIPEAARKGRWSQTVWQTDDSPRYGGLGRWTFEDGATRWISEETPRPLARRDAVRKPVYGWYVGTNRHALTPAGWIHEQDNAKIGLRDGKSVTFVHEVVLNTYSRFGGFDVAAADSYWAGTREYWAEVRKAWDEAAAKGKGISLEEEAEAGSVTGPTLMGLADEILKGEKTTKAAIAEARQVIAEETGGL